MGVDAVTQGYMTRDLTAHIIRVPTPGREPVKVIFFYVRAAPLEISLDIYPDDDIAPAVRWTFGRRLLWDGVRRVNIPAGEGDVQIETRDLRRGQVTHIRLSSPAGRVTLSIPTGELADVLRQTDVMCRMDGGDEDVLVSRQVDACIQEAMRA